MSITTRGWGADNITTMGWGLPWQQAVFRALKEFTLYVNRSEEFELER